MSTNHSLFNHVLSWVLPISCLLTLFSSLLSSGFICWSVRTSMGESTWQRDESQLNPTWKHYVQHLAKVQVPISSFQHVTKGLKYTCQLGSRDIEDQCTLSPCQRPQWNEHSASWQQDTITKGKNLLSYKKEENFPCDSTRCPKKPSGKEKLINLLTILRTFFSKITRSPTNESAGLTEKSPIT